MDGLAATLAGDRVRVLRDRRRAPIHPDRHACSSLALAGACACVGFLPFNLRRRGKALVFMGDSGSQVLGFTLASLGLLASWNVAGSTVATLLLPILILAVPILDTTLVTIVRLLEGRPISPGRARPLVAPARALRPVREARRAAARADRDRARRRRASRTTCSTTSGSRSSACSSRSSCSSSSRASSPTSSAARAGRGRRRSDAGLRRALAAARRGASSTSG